ncbi:MAG TPA: DinB family protein, partial [Blastocatellia bacterium]|nr:DinB family protein [Blastocatellia bacterium]
TADVVSRLCSGLTRAQQTWKPSDSDFSVLENICHLRDVEAEGYAVRIERILIEKEPELADLDGSRLAAERNYNSADLAKALVEFGVARERSLSLLRGAAPASLERRGNLEGAGLIRLSELVTRIVEHDRSHIEELEKLKTELPPR